MAGSEDAIHSRIAIVTSLAMEKRIHRHLKSKPGDVEGCISSETNDNREV